MLCSVMKNKPSLDNDFLFLIYDVAQLMRRHADSRARKDGMTRAQWALLSRLERHPDSTQSDLAQQTDVEPITVGRLIDRLEVAGFVERRPDPTDRRIWRLRVTAKSAPLLREIEAFRGELNKGMSKGVDDETLKALVKGLQMMRFNLSPSKSTGKAHVQRGVRKAS